MNLSNNTLYIWIEGEDDFRFFDRIMRPHLRQKYEPIKLVRYAHRKTQRINDFIKNIKRMNAHYLFVVDANGTACVTQKKEEIKRKYRNVDEHRIIVVIRTIESWYVAGLHHTSCKSLGVPYFRGLTETVAKDRFNRLMPKKLGPRTNFMIEILNRFSVETAKKRNGSFRYFIEKHDC